MSLSFVLFACLAVSSLSFPLPSPSSSQHVAAELRDIIESVHSHGWADAHVDTLRSLADANAECDMCSGLAAEGLRQSGKVCDAVKYAEKAVIANPIFDKHAQNVGLLLTSASSAQCAQSSRSDAIRSHYLATRLNPSFAAALFSLAQLLAESDNGRARSAISFYLRAHRSSAGDLSLEALGHASHLLLRDGRAEEAVYQLKPHQNGDGKECTKRYEPFSFCSSLLLLDLLSERGEEVEEKCLAMCGKSKLACDSALQLLSSALNCPHQDVRRTARQVIASPSLSRLVMDLCHAEVDTSEMKTEASHLPFCNHAGMMMAERQDMDEAASAFRLALHFDNCSADALNNLALTLMHLRRHNEAVKVIEQASGCTPSELSLPLSLTAAEVYRTAGMLDSALASVERRCHAKPSMCKEKGVECVGESLRGMTSVQRRCIAARSFLRLLLCEWKDREEDTQYVNALSRYDEGLSPVHVLALDTNVRGVRETAERKWRGYTIRPPPYLSDVLTRKGIVIAYAFSDFVSHDLGGDVVEVLCSHRAHGVYTVGVSWRKQGDNALYRSPHRDGAFGGLQHCTDEVISPTHSTDALALAEHINHASVTLLIDMNGWTDGGRPDVLALRPTPLQLHGKGFPSSAGHARVYDGSISDRVAMPADFAHTAYSEKLIVMPKGVSYHVNAPRPSFSPSSSDIKGGIRVCNSNRLFKHNVEVVKAWVDALSFPHMEAAKLVLQNSSSTACTNVKKEFDRIGGKEESLQFAPVVSDQAQYYSQLSSCTVFADSFVYGAHGTAIDALWAGVPFVTLPSVRQSTRVGASLLASANCEEWIARSIHDYTSKVAQMARQDNELSSCIDSVKSAPSTLFDVDRWAAEVERMAQLLVDVKKSRKESEKAPNRFHIVLA
uniref:O-GlcNAc transferase C-terminal domain-containing protein n=2 Tax=Palpitomonas bilix TaxID=652834 RepID=A0A7S3G3L5_9EUKA|mmetsp:Transcript_19274/g.49397  ORF Transcript_19274/g.49397 Transcript_19274/m.49397 type:complete len:895 (+) Transcript_19274:138-2822(+)